MAALNGTANDAAHIDIVSRTTIRAIAIQIVNNTAEANGAYVRAEVAFNNANMLITNDALGVIAACERNCNLTTSGATGPTQLVLQGLDIPVVPSAGSLARVYLNIVTGQAATGWVTVYLYVD